MDHNFIADVITTLERDNIRLRYNAPLSDYTTFRLGGRCPCLIHCETPAQVKVAVAELAKNGIDFTLIGAGSNLLISDKGIPSVVIRFVGSTPSIKRHKNHLVVSGCTELDELVQYAVNSGIDGFVNCSGIPGTVGGAIAGNAGAFGWQIADCLESIEVINKYGYQQTMLPEDISFSYRSSGLRSRQKLVLKAHFRTSLVDTIKLQERRQEILQLRTVKHPDISIDACAGSFFKNIEPTSAAARRQAAGWFLEQVGAKKMRVGGAGVFEKHANIIVQKGNNCTSQDVFSLSCKMAEAVKERFGIQLVREVQLLGEF